MTAESSLHKLNSSLDQVWGEAWDAGYPPNINDLHKLSNGDFFCCGNTYDTSSGYWGAAFLKFGPAGALIFEKHLPAPLNNFFSPMEKLPNGQFVCQFNTYSKTFQDSTMILMVDSNANIIWSKKYQQALRTGPGKVAGNKIVFPLYTNNPALFSIAFNGNNSCGHLPVNFSLTPRNYTQVAISYTAISSTITVVSSTMFAGVQNQTYQNICGSTVNVPNYASSITALTIFPNPVTDKLFVNAVDGPIPGELKVYDLSGRMAATLKVHSGSDGNYVYTSELSPGLFFLSGLNEMTTRIKFAVVR